MNSNKKAFKQLFFMLVFTILTQVITLIKISVTARNFGATIEMDAFNFSNSIGTFIFSFIGTGITTVLIPAIVNKKNMRTINNFITILYSISISIVLIVFLIRRPIVSIFSSGNDKFINIACSLMLITLISQFFNTIISVTNAVFQCNGKFNVPKILTLGTTAMLTLLVFINKDLTIYEYAFYILITGLLNLILHVILTYKEGFIYKPLIDIKDEELPYMIKVFIPTVFSSGLYQVTLLTDSLISSTLGEGQISMLGYSNNIMSMINLLLTTNLVTYIYPKIAEKIKRKDGQKRLFEYFMFFNLIMCLMTIGFLSVGKEAIVILYEGGKFTSSVTSVVYLCTSIYTLGLPINIMREVIYRYFYAQGNTKTTFVNSITASIFNIIVSIILSRFIGIYGVVLGTVLTSVFSLTSILIRFKKAYSMNFNKKFVIIENVKVFLAAIISVVITLFLKSEFIIKNDIISLLVYGVLVVILYVIMLLIFKTKAYKVELT